MARTLEPTARELEVLMAVTEQRATRMSAARALGISPETVKATLDRLYTKLDVKTAAQALRVLHDRSSVDAL